MTDTVATIVVYGLALLVMCIGMVGLLYFGKKSARALFDRTGMMPLRRGRLGVRLARGSLVVGFVVAALCVIGFLPIGTQWSALALGVDAGAAVAMVATHRVVERYAHDAAEMHANSLREE